MVQIVGGREGGEGKSLHNFSEEADKQGTPQKPNSNKRRNELALYSRKYIEQLEDYTGGAAMYLKGCWIALI